MSIGKRGQFSLLYDNYKKLNALYINMVHTLAHSIQIYIRLLVLIEY